MDINYLLIWMICIASIISLGRVIFLWGANNRGWIMVCCLILGLTLGISSLNTTAAVFIGGLLWGVLWFIPMMGFSYVKKLVYQERYQEAHKVASYLRWLHPADGWIEQTELLLALEMGHNGKVAEAKQIIKRCQNTTTNIARRARTLRYLMGADWDKYLDWLKNNVPIKNVFQEPFLMICYLRALGETGNLNALLKGIAYGQKYLEKRGDTQNLEQIRLFALAFCGKTEEVRQLFVDSSLEIYSEHNQKFWIATSEIVAGNQELAYEQLQALRGYDLILNNAIDWRLSHIPVKPEQELTESSDQILAGIITELEDETKEDEMMNIGDRTAYVTYTLIVINLTFFLLEINTGGSENIDNLYYLGALVPQNIWQGQSWRLLTANFLHFGWLHLVSNMMGLYFLGPFVEFRLGWHRYILAYTFSGVGAMFAFAVISTVRGEIDTILIGASAAIMGLFGVICAIFLKIWREEKSRFAAKRLRTLLFVLA